MANIAQPHPNKVSMFFDYNVIAHLVGKRRERVAARADRQAKAAEREAKRNRFFKANNLTPRY